VDAKNRLALVGVELIESGQRLLIEPCNLKAMARRLGQ
jgi:hypothetical protein